MKIFNFSGTEGGGISKIILMRGLERYYPFSPPPPPLPHCLSILYLGIYLEADEGNLSSPQLVAPLTLARLD